ncbi:hypothetical protein MB46_19555 (plasmid) [Arthrobacter alpinus]|uniref:CHAP domain-containing protein n=1 Tax=Arthrobacter alpinus TaxID=656366 RepID=UPI0005CB78F8|nr:CHAP domain-containing protein [Arthrobacter alpinus]ALV47869.1 hypothetical protein MB46_19555 [Arthrobacter alpinus]
MKPNKSGTLLLILRLIGVPALPVIAIFAVIGLSLMGIVALSVAAGNGSVDDAGNVCRPVGGESTNQSPKDVREQQIANAKLMDKAAADLGLSGQASRIVIIAGMGESNLENKTHGDDAVNPDGTMNTSLGILQQQWSLGWGTREQVMDVSYAATSFLIGAKHDRQGGLVSILHWEATSWVSSVIHQVQKNSERDHYTEFIADADSIIKEAGIDVTRAGSDGEKPKNPNTVGQCDGGSSSVDPKNANDDYPFDNVPPAGVYVNDPWMYGLGECTSFVTWRINRDAGSTSAPWTWGGANFLNGDARSWKDKWIARGWTVSNVPVAGAVAWWGSNGGGGVGAAGHVAYVQSVTQDGKAIIEEYNHTGYAPAGHMYSIRPEPVDPSEVNMFLYPPPKG